jgi:4,5-DOPA dioxygenase extradiol
MSETIMPVVFAGHGSPMLALEDTNETRGLRAVGDSLIRKYGKPKAILAVSAHWYTNGTFIQTAESPKQVYDMYGFPDELYAFRYPAKGDPSLGQRVLELLGDKVSVNNDWGIDHGSWTVLCHMFPEADIPVVQLSVNGAGSAEEAYEIGKALKELRREGILILASGNIVHNLRLVDWNNKGGSDECLAFDKTITDAVLKREDASLISYEKLPLSRYAVPTPDHYLPLIYALGASEKEKAVVFNRHAELGAISMTGYVFGS